MTNLRALMALLRNLAGLFVDDGSLAASALLWVAACGLVAPWAGIAPLWQGAALALGLAAILVENAARAGRRRQQR